MERWTLKIEQELLRDDMPGEKSDVEQYEKLAEEEQLDDMAMYLYLKTIEETSKEIFGRIILDASKRVVDAAVKVLQRASSKDFLEHEKWPHVMSCLHKSVVHRILPVKSPFGTPA